MSSNRNETSGKGVDRVGKHTGRRVDPDARQGKLPFIYALSPRLLVAAVAVTAVVGGGLTLTQHAINDARAVTDLSGAVEPGSDDVDQTQWENAKGVPMAEEVKLAGPDEIKLRHRPKHLDTPALRDRVETLGQTLADTSDTGGPTEFRIATLNVLGASHSDGGNAGKYSNGADRTRAAAAKIKALGISVVGLQEYEPENHNAFVGATGWGVFPGMTMGIKGVRNSIAWNPSVWQLVESHTSTFPYFRGQPVPLPYVLLEHQVTGQRIWVMSVHNPVSNKQRGQNQHWRDVATAKEASLMRTLHADTGYPVFLTGDFNEREEALHGITGGGGVVAAGISGIDWIFGTSDVSFSGYVRDDSTRGRISDHPLVYATATLD